MQESSWFFPVLCSKQRGQLGVFGGTREPDNCFCIWGDTKACYWGMLSPRNEPGSSFNYLPNSRSSCLPAAHRHGAAVLGQGSDRVERAQTRLQWWVPSNGPNGQWGLWGAGHATGTGLEKRKAEKEAAPHAACCETLPDCRPVHTRACMQYISRTRTPST